MRLRGFASAWVLALLASAALAAPATAVPDGPDIHDTRLLSEPTVSADRVAFIYAGDLWVAGLDGHNVKRLTADVIAGRDPQLEKEISVVMDELAKNPPKTPKRPPYPDKSRRAGTGS